MSYLEEHRSEIFKKYTDDILLKDIENYKTGNGRLYKVLNHFFEEVIFESCGRSSKISPMDVLKDDSKLQDIFEYIKTKPNFYKGDDVANLKSYFRNAVSWVRKVANFCPKNARDIYFRYNDINGEKLNILDTSAGFGSRMSSVLLSGHNYCAFDPNKKLYGKLKEYLMFLRTNRVISDEQKCGLYCKGSEEFVPNLVDTFDVSFTSPPYFNLETYSDDENQSTKNYDNYDLWVCNFVKPTIENTYKYLKIGGYAMINIKNINKKATLFDDFYKAFSEISGFEFVETFDMTIPSKKNYGMSGNYDISPKEPIMVFRKVR